MAKTNSRAKRLNPWGLLAVAILVALFGTIGYFLGRQQARTATDHPKNLVWVVDETVNAPSDLMEYLRESTKDDCRDYKGTNSVDGVALTAVLEVIGGKYAKVAVGCSSYLDGSTERPQRYFPVIKSENGWKLISAARYWQQTESTLAPTCSIVEEFNIEKSFAPKCFVDKEAGMVYTEADLRTVE